MKNTLLFIFMSISIGCHFEEGSDPQGSGSSTLQGSGNPLDPVLVAPVLDMTAFHDFNYDGKFDEMDTALSANSLNSNFGDTNYIAEVDINGDGTISIDEIFQIAEDFQEFHNQCYLVTGEMCEGY